MTLTLVGESGANPPPTAREPNWIGALNQKKVFPRTTGYSMRVFRIYRAYDRKFDSVESLSRVVKPVPTCVFKMFKGWCLVQPSLMVHCQSLPNNASGSIQAQLKTRNPAKVMGAHSGLSTCGSWCGDWNGQHQVRWITTVSYRRSLSLYHCTLCVWPSWIVGLFLQLFLVLVCLLFL